MLKQQQVGKKTKTPVQFYHVMNAQRVHLFNVVDEKNIYTYTQRTQRMLLLFIPLTMHLVQFKNEPSNYRQNTFR